MVVLPAGQSFNLPQLLRIPAAHGDFPLLVLSVPDLTLLPVALDLAALMLAEADPAPALTGPPRTPS
jgi:hypothetical protein